MEFYEICEIYVRLECEMKLEMPEISILNEIEDN